MNSYETGQIWRCFKLSIYIKGVYGRPPFGSLAYDLETWTGFVTDERSTIAEFDKFIRENDFKLVNKTQEG